MKIFKFFILSIIFALSLAGCKKVQKPLARKEVSVPLTEKVTAKETSVQESEFLLNELKQKNPFKAEHVMGMGGGSEAASVLNLKGIVWDSARPFAVIGDSVVVEGDYVLGKKVIKIDKDFIELDNNGVKEILKLGR